MNSSNHTGTEPSPSSLVPQKHTQANQIIHRDLTVSPLSPPTQNGQKHLRHININSESANTVSQGPVSPISPIVRDYSGLKAIPKPTSPGLAKMGLNFNPATVNAKKEVIKQAKKAYRIVGDGNKTTNLSKSKHEDKSALTKSNYVNSKTQPKSML